MIEYDSCPRKMWSFVIPVFCGHELLGISEGWLFTVLQKGHIFLSFWGQTNYSPCTYLLEFVGDLFLKWYKVSKKGFCANFLGTNYCTVPTVNGITSADNFFSQRWKRAEWIFALFFWGTNYLKLGRGYCSQWYKKGKKYISAEFLGTDYLDLRSEEIF